MIAQSSGSSRSRSRSQTKQLNRLQLPAASLAASSIVISPIVVLMSGLDSGLSCSHPLIAGVRAAFVPPPRASCQTAKAASGSGSSAVGRLKDRR